MPLTNGQRTNFFTAGVQTGLTAAQRLALANEGLVTEADFVDFQSEELKNAFKNICSGVPGVLGIPGVPAVVDAEGNEVTAAIAAVPPIPGTQAVHIPARSASRLLVAAIAWHYYNDTGREINAANMHYHHTLRDFHTEWKAIKTLSDISPPKVPILSKTNPPLRWCESFKNVCYNTYGVRTVPLLYIIRETVDVTPETGADPNVTYETHAC